MRVMGQLTVRPALPSEIARLDELACNLWWSWHPDAQSLYQSIDPSLWEQVNHNPPQFLRQASQRKLELAARDPEYLGRFHAIMAAFDAYMHPQPGTTWCERAHPGMCDGLIAYFSAEFGLHESLPIYSGGLGILSGDHCKTASDLGLPFVGVGFLYPQGYFQQTIDADGRQQAVYEKLDFSDVPAMPALGPDGKHVMISVDLPGRTIYAEIWRIQVGRVPIYLLDTDVERNMPADRELSARLYGGDRQMRISQELVLGTGGVRALRALGLRPTAWHLNEGHAAFLQLERLREFIQEQGLAFPAALWATRGDSVFTTHTPVPAGNDAFDFDLIDRFFGSFWPRLGLDREAFLNLGRFDNPWGPQFSMTVLALRTTSRANGVSQVHEGVARRMWQGLWADLPQQDVPIGHVTNGVHIETWLHPGMAALFDRYLETGWRDTIDERATWKAVEAIPDAALWEQHRSAKMAMLSLVRGRVARRLVRLGAGAADLESAKHVLDPRALTIGFARRFATYKRATLLFRDPERLKRILNDPARPVQVVFAGKAHPADEPGKGFIQAIYALSKQPGFSGRIIFVEDYDASMARSLVAGVDLWLNNPRKPLEACGTSGQKAGLNGVPNFSVLDGWWVEGYDGGNGWAIGADVAYPDENSQDDADASSLYDTLEQEIIPLFYERDAQGIPGGWIAMRRASIASVAPAFSTHRMLKQYMNDYYVGCAATSKALRQEGFARARQLAEWEARVRSGWAALSLQATGPANGNVSVGQAVNVQATLRSAGIRPDDVAVELVYGRQEDGQFVAEGALPMSRAAADGDGDGYVQASTLYVFDGAFPESGKYAYGVRVRPDQVELPNAFAVPLVKWA